MTLVVGVTPFFNKAAGRLTTYSESYIARLGIRTFRTKLFHSQTRKHFSVTPLVTTHSRRFSLPPVCELQPTFGLGYNAPHHSYSRHCSHNSSRSVSSDGSFIEKTKLNSAMKGVDECPKEAKVAGPHEHHPDGLTRYPTTSSANGILRGLDWLGKSTAYSKLLVIFYVCA